MPKNQSQTSNNASDILSMCTKPNKPVTKGEQLWEPLSNTAGQAGQLSNQLDQPNAKQENQGEEQRLKASAHQAVLQIEEDKKYYLELLRKTYTRSLNRDDREDILQETLVGICKELKAGGQCPQDPNELKPWVTTRLNTRAVDHFRKKNGQEGRKEKETKTQSATATNTSTQTIFQPREQRITQENLKDLEKHVTPALEDTIEANYDESHVQQTVQSTLEKMPEAERAILKYEFFQDTTQREAASELGISDSYYRKKLGIALEKYRNLLISNKSGEGCQTIRQQMAANAIAPDPHIQKHIDIHTDSCLSCKLYEQHVYTGTRKAFAAITIPVTLGLWPAITGKLAAILPSKTAATTAATGAATTGITTKGTTSLIAVGITKITSASGGAKLATILTLIGGASAADYAIQKDKSAPAKAIHAIKGKEKVTTTAIAAEIPTMDQSPVTQGQTVYANQLQLERERAERERELAAKRRARALERKRELRRKRRAALQRKREREALARERAVPVPSAPPVPQQQASSSPPAPKQAPQNLDPMRYPMETGGGGEDW